MVFELSLKSNTDMKNTLLILALICFSFIVKSQDNNDLPKYYDNPLVIDSSSVVLIPIFYKPHVALKQNELWGTHY